MSVSVATINAMRALPTSGFNLSLANTVYVATQDDFYRFVPGGTLTPTTGLVYASSDGLGQWNRMLIPSVKWRAQTTWSIDESNVTGRADDEGTGADDSHPLASIDEFVRRIGDSGMRSSIVVRWLSDTTHQTVNLEAIRPSSLAIGASLPTLTFLGVPTVVRTGTLTGAADGAATAWTVSDSSLPVSWAASVGMSSAAGSRLIRKTDKTRHAFLAYESVAKTAATSPTAAYSATNMDPVFGGGTGSFANGDAYEVIRLPSFPDVTFSPSAADFNGVVCIYLDFTGGVRGTAQVRLSGYRNYAGMWNMFAGGGTSNLGVIVTTGGSISGNNQNNAFDRSIFLGAFQFNNWNGDMNTYVNVVAKGGRLTVLHGCAGRLGTVNIYDCTGTAIQISNVSAVTVDGLHGSGNLGLIVDVRDSGCSVNSTTTTPLTAFDATTSVAKPISVVGTTYDYANIPITAAGKNAYFVTN